MSGSDTRNEDRERLDALLSAERDGALAAGERAELDALLAADPAAAAARRAAFASVDDALREMATPPFDAEGIESRLAALRARTGGGDAGAARMRDRRPVWRHPAVSLGIAAAAAFLLYLAVGSPAPDAAPEAPSRIAVMPEDAPTAPALRFEDEDMAIVLGYGEGSDLVPGVDDADLPVIEALDVLDFMSELEALEAEGRG